VEAAVTVLSALRSEADVLILLAYDAADAAQAIVEAIPELDVVVDTRQNRQHAPPLRIGNTLWVRSHYQTMRLGELRLNTTTQGDVELVVDRKIDLDSAISSEPTMLRQMQQAREELNAIQSKLFGLVE
jgi:hypothetical protein